MATKTTQNNTPVSRKRVLSGKVVSTKMKDTVVVLVERYVKHPKYQKFQNKSKRYKAHDTSNSLKVGDTVRIEECAPISRDKHFKVIEKTASAKTVDLEPIAEIAE